MVVVGQRSVVIFMKPMIRLVVLTVMELVHKLRGVVPRNYGYKCIVVVSDMLV